MRKSETCTHHRSLPAPLRDTSKPRNRNFMVRKCSRPDHDCYTCRRATGARHSQRTRHAKMRKSETCTRHRSLPAPLCDTSKPKNRNFSVLCSHVWTHGSEVLAVRVMATSWRRESWRFELRWWLDRVIAMRVQAVRVHGKVHGTAMPKSMVVRVTSNESDMHQCARAPHAPACGRMAANVTSIIAARVLILNCFFLLTT